jgi:hypothetical protein
MDAVGRSFDDVSKKVKQSLSAFKLSNLILADVAKVLAV